MSLILNIDTATERASVCLSQDEIILAQWENEDQKNHASFIQPAINRLTTTTGITLAKVDAVAITGGPGSYTGLRVGMATAKGICYALNKPLIIINTLEVMAEAARQANPDTGLWYCPLIDARRMEVFTAIYDANLQTIMPPQPMIVEANSFATYLQKQPVLFTGSGMQKLKQILIHPSAQFSDLQHHAGHLSRLALKAFVDQAFADLAYCEPLYLKAFFDPSGKRKEDKTIL